MYKWFRKAIAVVLAGTLVMTCAPLEALAADTGTDGGAAATVTRTTALLAEGTDWTLDLNDTLKIESNAGMINWRSHKSLNWDYSTKLKDHVRNVEIGMQVTYIIENAFGGCENLASVTIPNSIKTIGKQAFQYCIALTSVVIPNGVESIEYAAFDNCTNLKSVTFPDSLTTIGYGAFNNCNGLTSVTIPDSVTSIQCPFIGCDNLQNINVNSGNNSYTSIDGILFTKDLMELVQYPTGKEKTSYTIPSSVTSIADYAFYMCNNLTSLTIPDSVTTIGDRAFDNCDNLTVYCDANSYAETYCKENNIPYKPLSEYPSEGLLLVTNTLTLEKGTTGKLSVFGTGPKTWTSADPNIATVSADEGGNSATVTAVSEGETTITVTCGAESATAKIIVTSSSTGDEEGEKTSFVLNPANLTLEEESQGVVIPENVPDTQMVYWSSSDETVVSLDYDTTFGEKIVLLKQTLSELQRSLRHMETILQHVL